jgi:tRNA dimethylallyltransferase
MPNHRIISVIGPTASGKTALAANLAQTHLRAGQTVLIFSLDSRQIYREFPILSGADLPLWQQLKIVYPKTLSIWGLADHQLATEFSLGVVLKQWQKFVRCGLPHLTLLLGGTLLYHEHLLAKNNLVHVPPNQPFRHIADKLSLQELQSWLQKLEPTTYKTLNQSDRANPRRLQRKIEIAMYRCHHPGASLIPDDQSLPEAKQEFLQPPYQISELKAAIIARVNERFQAGAVTEVRAVWRAHPDLAQNPALMSRLPLGFKEISAHLQGQLSKEECLGFWSLHEWQYAKRQLTYLKKLTLNASA